MKKLVNLLTILLILYFGIEISFIKLNKGHDLEYKIKKNNKVFNIKEVYKRKRKKSIILVLFYDLHKIIHQVSY